MQQEKMGTLIRELRKEKHLTQEQMAEQFGVTNRTVSRWENGKTAPDISILVEMAEYFQVGILELIEGERKEITKMEEKVETEEIKAVADYADKQKRIMLKNIHRSDLIGLVSLLVAVICFEQSFMTQSTAWLLSGVVCMGIVAGMLCKNITKASGIDGAFDEYKKKYRMIRYVMILLVIILICSLIRDCYRILTWGI